jgi:hypothetical protein
MREIFALAKEFVAMPQAEIETVLEFHLEKREPRGRTGGGVRPMETTMRDNSSNWVSVTKSVRRLSSSRW